MKKIRTIVMFLLIGFISQAQDFDLKGYLELNQITEGTFNTVPELSVEHPDADSIKRYVKRVTANRGVHITGYPIFVSCNLNEKMSWIGTTNGMSIGILKVKCTGAKKTGLTFNLDNLPENLKVYFTNTDISKNVSFDEHNLKFLRDNNVKEAFLRQLEGESGYLIIILPTINKDELRMSIKYVTYGIA